MVAIVMLSCMVYGCASYNQQASGFYSSLVQGNYEKASKNLDQNKLLKKNRNRLLYLLEKGKVEHLLQHYERSNQFLEEADQLMESGQQSAKDIVAGTLVNPMMKRYRGEDFEKYMVHYYKALNYLQLQDTEEALVEARRISLRQYAQEAATNGKHYTQDAFSLILQSLIYEKAGDLNNAFIACRNAANLYLDHNGSYYGTPMPGQLKTDLLRLAWQNGFMEELSWYEEKLGMKWSEQENLARDELVIFWENGRAPVKKEENVFFSLNEQGGNYFFTDNRNRYKIPFDHSATNNKIGSGHSFRLAIPYYEPQPLKYHKAQVHSASGITSFEPAQAINDLAIATMNEQRVKEMARMLTRIALKKLAEEAAKPDKDEKDSKQKNRMEAVSLGLKIFSLASEKADTRNWQSLPHTIHYARIPLMPGKNKITIEISGNQGQLTHTLEIENRGGLQFSNLSTL